MQVRNTTYRYGLVSKALHWGIALLILGLVWLGWFLVDLSYYDPWQYTALTAHQSLGMLVLALAAFKLVWLVCSPNPAPQSVLTHWERRSSKLAHWVLFALMFLVPVSGYLTSTSDGAGVPLFDWAEIPALVPVSNALRDRAIEVHFYTSYGVLFLAVLHAAAALKHELVDGHRTLRRML